MAAAHTRSPTQNPGRLRSRLLALAAVLVAACVLLFVFAWRYAPRILAGPVLSTLVVQGALQHVAPETVRTAVLPALGRGFFSTDVAAVQAAVEALPWVAQATVRRSWPHTLYVQITEEVPVARWNGDALVDARGRVFVRDTSHVWAGLPRLNGPDASAPDVLAEYSGFAALLATRGLGINQLSVDARGASSVELANGIEVRLGREDATARLERFASVALPALGAALPSVAYVDMRYTNGFAVGARPVSSAECQGHSAPAERRHREVTVGQGAKDGSQGACATTNEVRSNG